MSDNPEFDKALKAQLGDAIKYLDCPFCGAKMILCSHCHEATCPNECEEDKKDEQD